MAEPPYCYLPAEGSRGSSTPQSAQVGVRELRVDRFGRLPVECKPTDWVPVGSLGVGGTVDTTHPQPQLCYLNRPPDGRHVGEEPSFVRLRRVQCPPDGVTNYPAPPRIALNQKMSRTGISEVVYNKPKCDEPDALDQMMEDVAGVETSSSSSRAVGIRTYAAGAQPQTGQGIMPLCGRSSHEGAYNVLLDGAAGSRSAARCFQPDMRIRCFQPDMLGKIIEDAAGVESSELDSKVVGIRTYARGMPPHTGHSIIPSSNYPSNQGGYSGLLDGAAGSRSAVLSSNTEGHMRQAFQRQPTFVKECLSNDVATAHVRHPSEVQPFRQPLSPRRRTVIDGIMAGVDVDGMGQRNHEKYLMDLAGGAAGAKPPVRFEGKHVPSHANKSEVDSFIWGDIDQSDPQRCNNHTADVASGAAGVRPRPERFEGKRVPSHANKSEVDSFIWGDIDQSDPQRCNKHAVDVASGAAGVRPRSRPNGKRVPTHGISGQQSEVDRIVFNRDIDCSAQPHVDGQFQAMLSGAAGARAPPDSFRRQSWLGYLNTAVHMSGDGVVAS